MYEILIGTVGLLIVIAVIIAWGLILTTAAVWITAGRPPIKEVFLDVLLDATGRDLRIYGAALFMGSASILFFILAYQIGRWMIGYLQ